MTPNILIVDDSLTVRMDLADAFGAAGFRPLPCSSVKEARALLAAERVDAAILDVILPDGDGIELLKEVRLLGSPQVIVLMLTREVEVRDRTRGFTTGADEYVGKPYDIGYVVARTRELLRREHKEPFESAPILLIDDSATFRGALAEALSGDGYRVLSASSGGEGLRIAALELPEAIIVDGVLPDMEGTTVIRQVRLDVALRRVVCVLLTEAREVDEELQPSTPERMRSSTSAKRRATGCRRSWTVIQAS